MATAVMLLAKVLHTVPMGRPELTPLVKQQVEPPLGVDSKVTRHTNANEGKRHLLPSNFEHT